MKTRTFIHILIFAALTLSACALKIKPPLEAETETATSKCFRSSDEVRLLINSVQGYCLQYPAEYDVFVGFPNESEIMLFKRSVLNATEPSVSIKVQPSSDVTLEKAVDQISQVYAIPGMEPIRESLIIDGESAIMLGGLSGQDPNRQVVIQHNDQLYYLFFIEYNKSDPEYAHFETLYNTVIQSFNFSWGSNACPDCPPLEEDPGGSISGWVWHDLCDSGKDGESAKAKTPEGCIEDVSVLGNYHADGLMSINEPLIEGVVITLGEGKCPSTGKAEQSTIITDLSYSFTGLKAGTYCVSIDSQSEPNFSILTPGEWTYPVITQDVINITVTLTPGEYKGMMNFGWDYQFQP